MLIHDRVPGFDEALVALAPLPPGVKFLTRPGLDLDVVLVFCTRRAELETRVRRFAPTIARDGRLWIAWPTKASKVPTDLDFATVQREGLDAGLVDNKSASITGPFQGLQFVRRLEDRNELPRRGGTVPEPTS